MKLNKHVLESIASKKKWSSHLLQTELETSFFTKLER